METELIARCIYSENTRSDRRSERIGFSEVILNRVNNASFPSTAYAVVTAKSQFSGINPGSFNAANLYTDQARSAKSKTNVAWQEATMLACIMYYTSNRTDISYFYTLPAGVSTHLYFLGYDVVYSSITLNNGSFYYGSSVLNDLAIAGYGVVAKTSSGLSYLQSLYSQGYSIFFNY